MTTVNIKCSGTFYEFRAAPAAFTGQRAYRIVSGMYGVVFGLAPDGKRYPVVRQGRSWLFAEPDAVLESGERVLTTSFLTVTGRRSRPLRPSSALFLSVCCWRCERRWCCLVTALPARAFCVSCA